MTLDKGASKTVVGDYWMKNFLDIMPDEEKQKIKIKKEDGIFRFGNKVRYPSKHEISIPIKLGQLRSFIHVSVVSANIPLLLGTSQLGLLVNLFFPPVGIPGRGLLHLLQYGPELL